MSCCPSVMGKKPSTNQYVALPTIHTTMTQFGPQKCQLSTFCQVSGGVIISFQSSQPMGEIAEHPARPWAQTDAPGKHADDVAAVKLFSLRQANHGRNQIWDFGQGLLH